MDVEISFPMSIQNFKGYIKPGDIHWIGSSDWGETTKKTEFMNMIKGCEIPEHFDQKLLDEASMMMKKWGEGYLHEGADSEYLFSHFGLNDKADDSDTVKKEKAALRCVASKVFKSGLHKNDAISIIKNFNSINEPGFRWLE